MTQGLLSGKVCVVTGAASGIGRASVLYFARAGATLCLLDIDATGLDAIGALAGESGGDVMTRVCDVRDETQITGAIDDAVSRFGRLDGAFNNAGISGPVKDVADFAIDEWNAINTMNLTSIFLCMKHEIRAMRGRNPGSIVNTSSGLAIVGAAGMGAYASSKSAINGLTRTAAVELARDTIRVNALMPGIVRTSLVEAMPKEWLTPLIARNPMGRLAEPEEIGAAAAWLISDQASFVSGQCIAIDGAQSVS